METATAEGTTIRKHPGGRPRKGNEKLTKDKVEELYRKGYRSPTAMAETTGCTIQNASNQMTRYIKDLEGLEDYKTNRADIIADKQRELIQYIDTAAIKEMSPKDRVVSFGILYDKERLERGQSTHNVANLHSIADRAIRAVNQAKPTELDVTPPDVAAERLDAP